VKSNYSYSFLEKLLFPKTRLDLSKLKSQLSGKTILITGASYGIGRSCAELLSQTGAHLILIARTLEALESLKKTADANGGQAFIYSLDLRKASEINSLLDSINENHSIDYFINNAGKSIRRPLIESLDRYHDFSRTMAINYEAPVKLALKLIPQLSENSGHLINISAINVLMAPAPYWAAYQASKSAFDQWFRSFHAEIEALGIKTTSIYLPLVKTRMMKPTKTYEKMPAMHPDHVALIVAKSILKGKKIHKPWWSILGEIGSVLFSKSIMRFHRKMGRK